MASYNFKDSGVMSPSGYESFLNEYGGKYYADHDGGYTYYWTKEDESLFWPTTIDQAPAIDDEKSFVEKSDMHPHYRSMVKVQLVYLSSKPTISDNEYITMGLRHDTYSFLKSYITFPLHPWRDYDQILSKVLNKAMGQTFYIRRRDVPEWHVSGSDIKEAIS